jgi:hypothetical protein
MIISVNNVRMVLQNFVGVLKWILKLIVLNAAAGKQYVLSVHLQLADQCWEFLPFQHHQEAHSVEQADERIGRPV